MDLEALLIKKVRLDSDQDKPSKLLSYLWVFTLVLNAQAIAIGSSIRYGFLTVSFSSRGIDGTTYGLVESSIGLGFALGFLSRKLISHMLQIRKCNPKKVMVFCMFMFAWLSLTSGLIFLVENNLIFCAVSLMSRLLYGFTVFMSCYTMLDIARKMFRVEFDFVNGMIQMGYFTGQGLAVSVGTMLYERYGYLTPFIFVTCYMVCTFVWLIIWLPNCDSILVDEAVRTENEWAVPTVLENKESLNVTYTAGSYTHTRKVQPRLSWMLFFPVIATMLVNNVYAYLQVSVTPYLLDNFGVSLTVGGTVVACIGIGVAVGSILSGWLSQKNMLHTFVQMSLGSLVVGLGLLLIYPHPSFTWLYENGPILAYPAVIICGLGDPIITVASLRAMEDLQLAIQGFITPTQILEISSLWLVGNNVATYAGPLIAGPLMEHLEFYQAAWFLLVFCAVSLMINIIMYFFSKKLEADYDERTPLLTSNVR